MTRRDFDRIAKVMLGYKQYAGNHETHSAMCAEMERALSETNPRFDARRFRIACGDELPSERHGKIWNHYHGGAK